MSDSKRRKKIDFRREFNADLRKDFAGHSMRYTHQRDYIYFGEDKSLLCGVQQWKIKKAILKDGATPYGHILPHALIFSD